MLLTISTTADQATDLGYVLHKNPARAQSFEMSFGIAHVFYPVAEPTRCTVALLVEIDPVGLVRNRRGRDGESRTLEAYVNDRPYAASSLLSVALRDAFSTALAGRCKERPELAEREWPLEARVSSLPGGAAMLRRLFEPLGYDVEATEHELDDANPPWGKSPYATLTLRGTKRVADLLAHLYVLMPVLDNQKHYWVGDDEVDKLVRHGAAWLPAHPERELITRRYLHHQRNLVRDALEQLLAEDAPQAEEVERRRADEEEMLERKLSLQERRIATVFSVLKASGARRVIDLGCGEGQLLQALSKERSFDEVAGMDVSPRVLDRTRTRLKLDEMPEKARERIKLMYGSLLYRDERFAGYDAAAVVEVVEHLDPPRLAAFERTVFEFARPSTVVVTTPNAEFNVTFDTLPAGQFRHKDHRFEWSRAQFKAWADGIAARFEYRVEYAPVGDEHATLGPPTQMGIFRR